MQTSGNRVGNLKIRREGTPLNNYFIAILLYNNYFTANLTVLSHQFQLETFFGRL